MRSFEIFLKSRAINNFKTLFYEKEIENNFKIKFNGCNDASVLNQIITDWNLNKLDAARGETSIDKYCFVHNDGNKLTLASDELEFGNYSLKVFVYKRDSPENFILMGPYTISVGTSPLQTSLNGGAAMLEVEQNENLKISFLERSYDPDLSDRQDKSDMRFFLFCVPSSGDSLLSSISENLATQDFDFDKLGLNTVLDYASELTANNYSVSI